MMNKRNILIVDDDIDVAELLTNVCDRQNFSTKVAHNGIDALKAMESYNPEIIFLDLIMDRMDGLELIRELTKNKWNGHVIISSGYHSSFVEMALDFCEVSSVKSAQVLEKPFTLSDVNKCLKQIENFHDIIDQQERFQLAAG